MGPFDPNKPLIVDPETEKRLKGRNIGMYTAPVKSEKEREIERKLTAPVPMLNFSNVPLKDVVKELQATQGINIFLDQRSLNEQGVSLEQPISLRLENISMKSALNLILKQAHLTYIIKDEVLQITTEAEAKGKMQRVVYQVADLVIPIPNAAGVLPMGTSSSPVNQPPYTPTPITGAYALGSGTSVGQPTGSPFATDQNGATVTKSAPTATREAELIKLITNTVDPRSWSDMGGPGTIDYHPLTMGLVIDQTPDIQEQIVDLLNSLRRLQDQEVALEVRFISISDDFFERIGVDFAMNITNQSANANFGPQLDVGAVPAVELHQQLQPEQADHRPVRPEPADIGPGHPDQPGGRRQHVHQHRPGLRRLHAGLLAGPGVPEPDPGLPVHGGRAGRQPRQRHAGGASPPSTARRRPCKSRTASRSSPT